MADLAVEPLGPGRYRVTVSEGASRTSHEVKLSDAERVRHGAASAEQLLVASFEFLLEREPKESILRSFELSVIERYFPEYPREIRKRLR